MVRSPCCPRNSQGSSPVPHFKSINSLAFSLLYGPTLISIHDYWKNCSFDYTHLCSASLGTCTEGRTAGELQEDRGTYDVCLPTQVAVCLCRAVASVGNWYCCHQWAQVGYGLNSVPAHHLGGSLLSRTDVCSDWLIQPEPHSVLRSRAADMIKQLLLSRSFILHGPRQTKQYWPGRR